MARKASGQVLKRNGRRGRVYALRFRAYGKRRYVTLGSAEEGWTQTQAEQELANVLADVRRGIWREPDPEPVIEAAAKEPDFRTFASTWVAEREPEVDERTVEYWRWALWHALEYFGHYRPSQITPRLVRDYKTRKLHEQQPLSASSLNKTLKVLAQVLDDAVDAGWLDSNPARGKKARVRESRPRRTWLELDEVRSLLDAAGKHRALIATMLLGGLRVAELCDLRWRSVNLASGKLTIEASKTDAGRRTIDISPDLVDELKMHKADADPEPDELVFPTRRGTRRDRNNVRTRVLARAVERANDKRQEAGVAPIADVTNHSLRRTFASLLYEAGASPAYVMAQLGHRSSALALEVYTKTMERKRDTGARMDALIRGADWAQTGTNGAEANRALPAAETTRIKIPLR